MPRKALGERPMTAAERQAKQRVAKDTEMQALREELRRIYKPMRADKSGLIGFTLKAAASAVFSHKDPDRFALIGRALGKP